MLDVHVAGLYIALLERSGGTGVVVGTLLFLSYETEAGFL